MSFWPQMVFAGPLCSLHSVWFDCGSVLIDIICLCVALVMPHYPLKCNKLSEQYDGDGNETPLFVCQSVTRVNGILLQGWTANVQMVFSLYISCVLQEDVCVCLQQSSNMSLMWGLIRIPTLVFLKKETVTKNRRDITAVVLQFYWLQKQSKNKLLFCFKSFWSEPISLTPVQHAQFESFWEDSRPQA